MPKELIDEREFELINIVGPGLEVNQRDLSNHLRLSLGATNMLIRRLIVKGYIRIQQLDKRKVKYMLTPKGFSEKLKKSIKYTMKTIRSLGLIKEHLKLKIIKELYDKGIRQYVILGKSDLALMIQLLITEFDLKDCHIAYVDELPKEKVNGCLLICKENINTGDYPYDNVIDLIQELANNQEMINNYQGIENRVNKE